MYIILNKSNVFYKNSQKRLNINQRIILFPIIILMLINITNSCSEFKKESKIRIRRNGYSNIVIGIEDQVEENTDLIENIKKSFTEASDFLYYVTKKRVFFKDIIIVVPSTWTLENYFDDYNLESYDSKLLNSTWESYDIADICIENRDYMSSDTPFVVNYASKCGQTANNINFSPNFFLKKDRTNKLFGPMANILVHFWSQFRYGVFPEFPHKTLENNYEFYLNENGEIEASRCSLNITGQIKNPFSENGKCETFLPNGLPSIECVFEEDLESDNFDSASVLNKPFLPQISEFCDDKSEKIEFFHNRFAPTIHNIECKGQSIWEVLRNHPDFLDYRTVPNENIKSTKPKFQILKNRVKKVILLVDKTIEVLFSSKIKQFENALNDYIKMINRNSLIGVVHFEKAAKIILKMTPVYENRYLIMEKLIPKNPTNSRSNIWNGISLALSLLRSTLDPNDRISPTGGNVILITSSDLDPQYPNMNSIIEQIKSNEITLDVIRFGETNDKILENIVNITSGFSFIVNDQNSIFSIQNCLAFIANRDLSKTKRNIQIANELYEYDPNELIQTFFVDSTISSRQNTILKLIFNFQNLKDYIDISVFDPNGVRHDSKINLKCKDSLFEDTPKLDPKYQNIVCEFKKPSEGTWIFRINSTPENSYLLRFQAFSFRSDYFYYASSYYDLETKKKFKRQNFYLNEIKTEAKWEHQVLDSQSSQAIYLALSLGNKPILNATVTAKIFRPTGDFVTVSLYDNGINADRFKDDGIYSRYFSNFNSIGGYYAKIEILTNENSKVSLQKIVGAAGYEHYPKIGIVNKISNEEFELPIQNVQRIIHLSAFTLNSFNAENDLIPPSKIKDLEAINFDYIDKIIKFSFTAPGDDFDIGKSAKYEIKIAYKKLDLLNEGPELSEDKLLSVNIKESSFEENPSQSGKRENFKLLISSYEGETISIKIRAVDVMGNFGEWSNVVTVKLNDKIKLSPQISNSEIKSKLSVSSNEYYKILEKKESFYSNLFISVIVFLAIIFMAQIILMMLLTFRKLKGLHEIGPVRV